MNNSELVRNQQQIIRKRKLDVMLSNMLIEKKNLMKKFYEYRDYIQGTKEDIESIKNVNLSTLYYKMYSNKNEKVGREELEKCAISAKYAMVLIELVELDKEIERTKKELSCLKECEQRYVTAFVKCVEHLKSIDSDEGLHIMELENKMISLDGQKKELTRVLEIGKVLCRTIKSVQIGLDSARSWGNIKNQKELEKKKKRQYIDNTQKSLYRMQLMLRKFYIELNDANISVPEQVIINEFLDFGYYFYDGVFGEKSLLEYIITAKSLIQQLGEQLSFVMKKLYDKICAIDEESKELHKEIESQIGVK